MSSTFMQESVHFSKLNYADSQYPLWLRESKNYPVELFVRGVLKDIPLVAVVGTRRPSSYGNRVTEELVTDLVRAGVGIVSGLALGVDGVAHEAALEAGGYTIAVLGCGIDQVYPTAHQKLAERILSSGGAIVSEYPPGMPALKQNFPARNRIIAGLSQAVVVTEADGKSGTLHTANFALDYGREVMAVPGDIYHETSVGPHNLIRQGAHLISESAHILDLLNLEIGVDSEVEEEQPMSANEAAIIGQLRAGVSDSQQIITKSGLDAAVFAQTIILLEISGQVKSLGAGQWGLTRGRR